MSQKIVFVPEIGEVLLSKRKGTTHIRLSINATGRVRVGLPSWAPYAAGITFAKNKNDWIQHHLSQHHKDKIKNGDLIGKSHRINFIRDPKASGTRIKVSQNKIKITSSLNMEESTVQFKIEKACERALLVEARKLLPQRLSALSSRYQLTYNSVKVRKLTARWGSCSSEKNITLSYFLIQLPWHLIDYVLLHELMHTKYLHHGKDFWTEFQNRLPKARQMQKEISIHKPRIYPNASFSINSLP